MTVETLLIKKIMTVSPIPDPSPAHGRREIRESRPGLSR